MSKSNEFHRTGFWISDGWNHHGTFDVFKLLPETTDTASYFSFYDVTEKVGIVIGMSVYGIIDQVTGSMRNSIVFLGLFFIIGVFLLLRIPKQNALKS